MALDKQRILGELGSVMKQLQSADCGCLGKLFGGPQQGTPSMGNPLPTCSGCRRSCCYGHGYSRYNSPNPVNQPTSMCPMTIDDSNSQHPMSGNMCGFGPQIVNMMRGDHNPQKLSGQGQGQLAGPMVIDAPKSPHGKVGITPITPPTMTQQGQFNPMSMNRGDVSGQIQQQAMPQADYYNVGNVPNMTQRSQNNNVVNSTAHYIPTTQSQPHGHHSQGIAKFNQMFPGVKQGLGGDLGFDPMAIAIQMNPDNHLKTAMNTMNKIMNDNKGINNTMGLSTTHTRIGGNAQQDLQEPSVTTQQNKLPNQIAQSNVNQPIPQQTFASQNIRQAPIEPTQQNTMNTYGQPISQQIQHVYSTSNVPSMNQQAPQYGESQEKPLQQHQQYMVQHGQPPIINQNSVTPYLPTTYEESAEYDQTQTTAPTTHSNEPEQVQQMKKDPILPADTSRNTMYVPGTKQNNYGYNTLGQPIEMLPAKIFHPPEPTLPQTLSPQPIKPRANTLGAVNVKATVSKTSLIGNNSAGRTPSRNQLQHIYHQYKGSQSFTQQNVRHPDEGTCSDGRLNVPQTNVSKAPPVPEKILGDAIVNNLSSEQDRSNKVEQVLGQIGDVPVAKPGGDTLPVKEAPVPVKKCRNGLQDIVFSSYPTSTAWTFHGHGQAGQRSSTSPHRYRNRHY